MSFKIERLNIFELWKKAEGRIGQNITLTDVALATGLAWDTVKRLREGKNSDLEKLATLANYLYKISGLKAPKKMAIAWLVWEDDEPIAPTPSAEDSDAPSQ